MDSFQHSLQDGSLPSKGMNTEQPIFGFAINAQSLGEAWLKLLHKVVSFGDSVDMEIKECRYVQVSIENVDEDDPILKEYAEPLHIEDMKLVFFTDEPNRFGHNYYSFLKGPKGRRDLSDIAEYLIDKPATKRAVLAIVGDVNKTPCLQAVHFLIRDGKLETSYFSRGQDIFSKYYADVLAVKEMSTRVSKKINLPCGRQIGFISSAHIYNSDIETAMSVLDKAGL